MNFIQREQPGPGQESVWDYPRPPRLERSNKTIRVEFAGRTIVETQRAYRVLETSHPPVYYVPPEDIQSELIARDPNGQSWCEWKGRATYHQIRVEQRVSRQAAWSYESPTEAFQAIRGYLAFYPSRVDACFVGAEQVRAQEGDFYGGWITSDIVGPFKGAPGTRGW